MRKSASYIVAGVSVAMESPMVVELEVGADGAVWLVRADAARTPLARPHGRDVCDIGPEP